MKRPSVIIGMFALVLPAGTLLAADQLKINTLTPKEIADGWILLFDGQTPFGWSIQSQPEAKAPMPHVQDGVLKLSGSDHLYETTSEFADFELRFEYKAAGKDVRLVLGGNAHFLPPAKSADKWTTAEVRVETKDGARTIRIKPDKPDETAKDKLAPRTAIAFRVPTNAELQLRDVKLKPMNMQSLFNGKDLKGWKIVPGHDSKFTVTDKGELNIKNGNGEIQTEGQWADFILQLDVFSNGPHLNSGIFFRALPGEFWQGYEAQIRNQWEGDDRTKPADFGTGGIYGRQASRKVVSTDKEWFTYTVLANGNHIALWLNGYQTADYFDTDKDAKTAREGRYLGKGTVSLQGHDPTTDLSFRNIRLQELPTAK